MTAGEDERSERAHVVQRVVLDDERVAEIRAQAAGRGHAVLEVDLAGCHDKAGLLERLGRTLTFPAGFGGNWDAWFDGLTDLGWLAPAPGYLLVLRRGLGMHRSAPEALDTALAIVEDAARVWASRGVTLCALVDLES